MGSTRVAEDQGEDVAWLRAERHADAHFWRALGHQEGHNSGNADGREQHGYSGEDGDQNQAEFALREGFPEHLLHGANLRDGLFRINRAHVRLNAGNDTKRVAVRGADDQIIPERGKLRIGPVNHGAYRFLRAIWFDVANNADNFAGQRRSPVEHGDTSAEGILSGPEFVSHSLVDEHGLWRGC